MKRKYGWKPDPVDSRDHMYQVTAPIALPAMIDLRSQCPPVYDQGQLGSCTANAIGSAHQFEQMKQPGGVDFMPSRLFIYFNERDMEGTTQEDSGAIIRDGIKSVAKQGVCPEALWPYNEKDFTHRPSAECYAEAVKHQVLTYSRLPQALVSMKTCLAQGFPFVFGFQVYDSFESDYTKESGRMIVPRVWEKCLGGHAVQAVGYDDNMSYLSVKGVIIVKNSWGTSWGDRGYFYMPYSFITEPGMASDFWTIRTVEE